MAKEKIEISIIIVNYNTPELTAKCIDSIVQYTKVPFEIIVVDNASSDSSVKTLSKYEKQKTIKLIESKKNLGFAGGNNLGIDKSQGNFILLINSDTEIKDSVIDNVAQWMRTKHKAGIASCTLIGPDGELQSPGGNFPDLVRAISWMTIEDIPFVKNLIPPFHLPAIKYDSPTKLDWVSGTFFMIKREVIKQIGKLDDDYFMYTEEVDYCFRAATKGWESWLVPMWSIKHYGKASSNNEFALIQEYKGIKLFYNKHYPTWQMPILRFFLKIGSLLRVIAFTMLRRPDTVKIYAKAYQVA